MATDPDKKKDAQGGGPKSPRAVAPQSRSGEVTKPPDRVWKPVLVSKRDELRRHPGVLHTSDVMALHAVWEGVANADQQRRAVLAIHKIASTGDMSYRPNDHGGERDSTFAEGKRYVGLQMQKLIDHHSLYVQDANDQA